MQKNFYTIGYEGASPEEFSGALRKAGVGVLLDVRAISFSRKPGFSKKPLREFLQEAGIGYLHLQGLGNPDKLNPGAVGDYRGRFENHMKSPEAQADLKKAAQIAREKPACLMCFERDPNHCHRLIVAGHLAALTGQEIKHLLIEKPLPLFGKAG